MLKSDLRAVIVKRRRREVRERTPLELLSSCRLSEIVRKPKSKSYDFRVQNKHQNVDVAKFEL